MTHDEYERRFMAADEVLVRERIRMAWWGHLLHLGAFFLALHAAATAGAWLGLVIIPLAWLVLMTLRVAVSRTDVHVQLGIFGPRIALADIEGVEAVTGGLWGFGARMVLEPIYSVPSSARDLVRITFRKGGRRRSVRFSSRDAPRMVQAIDDARAGVVRARIAGAPSCSSPASTSELAAREQAEAEAEVEEALGQRELPRPAPARFADREEK